MRRPRPFPGGLHARSHPNLRHGQTFESSLQDVFSKVYHGNPTQIHLESIWIYLVHAGLFLISLTGHGFFGWFAYLNEQQADSEVVSLSGYLVEMMRNVMENWQSEFLGALWQVGGLALLFCVGSPQSKETDDPSRSQDRRDPAAPGSRQGRGPYQADRREAF